MTKQGRRDKNQAIAAEMKRLGIERTTGRCCICNKVYHADFLDRGFASHRCDGTTPRRSATGRR